VPMRDVTRRDRFTRRRPGFMAITVGLSVLTTASIGYLGERLYDPREARAALLEESDASARDEMLAMGWEPLSADVAADAAEHLRAQKGVELLAAARPFSLPLGNGPVAGVPPDAASLPAVARLLADELGRYPRQLLGASRFRRVLLCSELSEDGRAIPSLPNYERTLLLGVDAPPDFLRRLIHHELYHFADYADDDQVERDPEWEKLNGKYFVYGSGGRFQRDPESSLPSPDRPGFVTPYAASALPEDKAETFAFMMVSPGAIAERTRSDPVLRSKTFAVKRQLERLCPEMNRDFWRRGGSVLR
jgi:hypothetical protein